MHTDLPRVGNLHRLTGQIVVRWPAVAVEDAERQAAGPVEKTGQRPAADHRVDRSAHAGAKLLVASKG